MFGFRKVPSETYKALVRHLIASFTTLKSSLHEQMFLRYTIEFFLAKLVCQPFKKRKEKKNALANKTCQVETCEIILAPVI